MSTIKNLDKWTFRHFLLSFSVVEIFYKLFYRKRSVLNKKNVPKNFPVIIAPNHQNALMDALAFISGGGFQPIFLARSDVFKGKFVISLLHACKILPIYRIRDGRSSLQKNDEVFDVTDEMMKSHRNPLCIFPEGNHGDRRRIRPLVKGIFRIAFRAQETYKSEPGVKIVPVGIEYQHYWKFRQKQLVNYGKPIEVCEYWDEFEKNPSVATNLLRNRLSEEMKKITIHIESEEYYMLYEGIRALYRKNMCQRLDLKFGKEPDNFNADKSTIEVLDKRLDAEPEKIIKLNTLYTEYSELRNKLNLRDWVCEKRKYSVVLNILGIFGSIPFLPIVVLGLLNNWPHFFLPLQMKKKIKDSQFLATAIWGVGMIVLFVYFILMATLAIVLIKTWWVVIAYLLTFFTTGIFVLAYRKFIIKAWARIRYSLNQSYEDSDVSKFRKKYDEIVNLLNSFPL